METTGRSATPWHLWVVGGLTLLWNAVGVMSYLVTEFGQLEALGMTPAQIAYFATFPAWATAVWALGVWGAFAGSVLLLLRSRWAVTALVIALVGLIGTTYFQHFVTVVPEDLRNLGLDVTIWVTTLFMLWYALKMRRESVLR